MELTTGQMIDKLQKGQIAERDDQFYQCFWGKGQKLIIKTLDSGKEDEYMTISDRDSKWTILSQYVTFEEAMKALKEGKIVGFHDGEEKRIAGYLGSMHWVESFSWKKLIDGKWTIEN
jgi:hypothetical protein